MVLIYNAAEEISQSGIRRETHRTAKATLKSSRNNLSVDGAGGSPSIFVTSPDNRDEAPEVPRKSPKKNLTASKTSPVVYSRRPDAEVSA